MSLVYDTPEYKKLKCQYMRDINKKIQLEKKYKQKARQVKRLENTIADFESDMAEYSKLFDIQTNIALAYMHAFNKIIMLLNKGVVENQVNPDFLKQALDVTNEALDTLNEGIADE